MPARDLETTREESGAVVGLSTRLLFSLLRAAGRLAARLDVPIGRLLELCELAYFEELRKRSPRDLAVVARRLGVSLRTAGSLNKRLKQDFFMPERDVELLREVAGKLVSGPKRLGQLLKKSDDDERKVEIERALKLLSESGFLEVGDDAGDPTYALQTEVRSYVGEDQNRRIDGLNNQLDIVVASVVERFLRDNNETAGARSWVFAARGDDLAPMIERTFLRLRHDAIDLEEAALKEGVYQRYGVTIAITPMKEEEEP